MKYMFEDKGKWLKQIQESLQSRNEVRYIDPANLDKYDKDDIEEVTKADGTKAYKRKTGANTASQLAKQQKATAQIPAEKELATQAALARINAYKYSKMIKEVKSKLEKEKSKLKQPGADASKIKEHINDYQEALKNLETHKKQASDQADRLTNKLNKYYPESFYVNDPKDTSDLIDVLDDKGQKHWVTQQTYDKHRAYFQNNLTKHQQANQRKVNTAELLDKADKLSTKIADTSKQLKGSYGANANTLDKELSKLKDERDSIYMQLYGKTYSQLRNK